MFRRRLLAVAEAAVVALLAARLRREAPVVVAAVLPAQVLLRLVLLVVADAAARVLQFLRLPVVHRRQALADAVVVLPAELLRPLRKRVVDAVAQLQLLLRLRNSAMASGGQPADTTRWLSISRTT